MQSGRLHQAAQIVAEAENVFGNAEKANAWLHRENSALNGAAPRRLLDTEEGARMVQNLLGRISHGIAA